MSETLETVKSLAPFATPFVTTIVEIFVKPKLQRLSKFLGKSNAEGEISLQAKFTEYLERSYLKHSYLPILVFQNQQRLLKDLYIPLSIRRPYVGSWDPDEEYKIDRYPADLVYRYKRILVKDTAGMGKSTLLKYLFLSCLESGASIPIFIEIRKLKPDFPIAEFIKNELNPINDEFDSEDIMNLIQLGNFTFFLDGYDEIPSDSFSKVAEELHTFISKAAGNRFILASRPDVSLTAFSGFMEFFIKPLEFDESILLLHKYDDGGELASAIERLLRTRDLEDVREFLPNPLLVSLLYKSYDYKRTIPLKKHLFYRQVYDALFETHDFTKEAFVARAKKSGLDIDEFHSVLRVLGFLTIRHGIEYEKEELLRYLAHSKVYVPSIPFQESKFLDDLLEAVPLFVKDGVLYRWAHKSLQDYFAAQYLRLDADAQKVRS